MCRERGRAAARDGSDLHERDDLPHRDEVDTRRRLFVDFTGSFPRAIHEADHHYRLAD